jgi:hypothetical protein
MLQEQDGRTRDKQAPRRQGITADGLAAAQIATSAGRTQIGLLVPAPPRARCMTAAFRQACCNALEEARFVAFAPFVGQRRAQSDAGENKHSGSDGILTPARHNTRVAYDRA